MDKPEVDMEVVAGEEQFEVKPSVLQMQNLHLHSH